MESFIHESTDSDHESETDIRSQPEENEEVAIVNDDQDGLHLDIKKLLIHEHPSKIQTDASRKIKLHSTSQKVGGFKKN